MAGHRKLSPSAGHRWMNCPGSVAKIGDDSSETNQAAMKGTAAHKVVEMMIQQGKTDATEFLGWTLLVKAAGDEETEAYAPGVAALDPNKPRPGWFLFVCDDEMVNGVQVTIDEVERQKAELFHPEVFSETFLDGSWLDPRCGGTADVRLVEPFGWAVLVDHKNGYILVEVEDNDQLLQYAVFVLHEHPDAEGVRIIISQPNAQHVDGPVRIAEYTRDEIKLYEIRMREKLAEIDRPNAPLRPGDWCTFCPANHRCEALDAKLAEEAIDEFSEDAIQNSEPPEQLPLPQSAEELARKMRWIPVLEAWASNIRMAAKIELENGNKVPGFKLVRGRANRKWSDDEMAIAEKLVEAGADNADLWTDPELKSPAQIEKVIKGRTKEAKAKREAVKAIVSEMAFQPDGQLTVAVDTDPREEQDAARSAADEFSEDDGGDFDP